MNVNVQLTRNPNLYAQNNTWQFEMPLKSINQSTIKFTFQSHYFLLLFVCLFVDGFICFMTERLKLYLFIYLFIYLFRKNLQSTKDKRQYILQPCFEVGRPFSGRVLQSENKRMKENGNKVTLPCFPTPASFITLIKCPRNGCATKQEMFCRFRHYYIFVKLSHQTYIAWD